MFESLQELILESKEGKIKLNQKASIFFFCLLLSTFFWFLSVLSKDYKTELNFSINYTGYSSDFILVKEPLDQIQARVSGSGYELLGEQLSLDLSPIEVDLNLAKPTRKKGTYFLLSRNLYPQLRTELDQDIQLETIMPDTLFFITQKRVYKEVPVKARIETSFDLGHHQRGELILKPSKVRISGPQAYIDTVQQIFTEQKQFANLADSSRSQLKLLSLKNVAGFEMETKTVELLIPVEKFTEKQLELEIQLKNKSGNYQIKTFPNQVSARFLVPLSLYEKLNNAMVNAYVEFDAEENRASNKLKVQLKGVPEYAEIIRIEPAEVEFIVKK